MAEPIFISYRRADSASESGRLQAAIINALGQGSVFMDIASIRVGTRWANTLDSALEAAKVLVVMIGPQWLTLKDVDSGQPRIFLEDDWVRREIEVALNAGKTVIPVLVKGATLPTAAELPDSLQGLTAWQGLQVRDGYWDNDIQPLLTQLQTMIAQQARVFISYRAQIPDSALAQTFYQALLAEGHQPFLAGSSLQLGENWLDRIIQALEQSDYFLLLLSPQSVTSEMVMDEVQRAKELQEKRGQNRPVILPIRINFPLDSPLTYTLRMDLDRIQQRLWTGDADTPALVNEVLKLIGAGGAPTVVEPPPIAPTFADIPENPPLPVAEPELTREPGGSVPLTSGLYVERYSSETGKTGVTIEADCFEEIMQPGALIRIKAPRQMGKTSLMARILNHAQQNGCEAIAVSLQRADRQMFSDLNKLLKWLCTRVGRRLKRLDDLADYWLEDMGVKDRCNDYFQECLLEESDGPIVLALDEVDLVFPHGEVADDFFGLLRSWYEAARYGDYSSELWAKLRLVVVHSTEAYVPLEINQSPFNVGKNVELPELTPPLVQDLAHRYGLPFGTTEVEQIMALVDGHPYLLRKAFYHLRRQELTLAELLETGPTEAGIYSDHLRRHLLNLKRYPELAAACREVVRRSRPAAIDPDLAFKLESMGLIRLDRNEATPLCSLYQQFFREHLKSSGSA